MKSNKDAEHILKIDTKKSISFNTKRGAEIYRRSMTLLLQCAIEELYPGLTIEIGQSLMNGYFFEFPPEREIPAGFTGQIEQRMRVLVSKDIKFIKKTLVKEDALKLYKKKKRFDKIKSVSYLKKKKINIVFLKKYFDFMLAECVESTGYLKTFRLIRYKHGFVLQFPQFGNISRLPKKTSRQKKLYEIYRETRDWEDILGVRHAYDLNKVIDSGKFTLLVKIQEAFHEKKIAGIADTVKKEFPRKRVIFVAGPSSSGKTTFLKRLGIQLRANGLLPFEISLDDYFVPRDLTPRLPNGQHDFECIEALDTKLFKCHMEKLLRGNTVEIPRYNFKTGDREKSGRRIRLCGNSVIMAEGIHGLNPSLSDNIPEKERHGIFVSALTQLCIDNDTRVFTSDSRLLRRAIRDKMFRGYSVKDTINRFPDVRQGEDQYIFPYQEKADIIFNSSLIYEQAVLKPMIVPDLRKIRVSDVEYYEARRLLSFLDFFQSADASPVPQVSILREFIGNSGFEY